MWRFRWVDKGDLVGAEIFRDFHKYGIGSHSCRGAAAARACAAAYSTRRFSLRFAPLSLPSALVVFAVANLQTWPALSTVSAFVKALDGRAVVLTFQA